MRGDRFDDERGLDRAAKEMSWEEQNWLFNRLMDRLWPDLTGKQVALLRHPVYT